MSPSSIFSCTTIASIFDISNSLLFTAVHVKMKLGDNTFNNDRLSLVMTKLPIKKLTNCSPYFTDLNIPIILKLKGNIKGRLISRIINLKKNLSSGLKIIR